MASLDMTRENDFASSPQPRRLDVGHYSPLQGHFLSRLARLLRLRQHQASLPGADPWQIQLLDRAIHSTLRDCQAGRVGKEAKELFKIYPTTPHN